MDQATSTIINLITPTVSLVAIILASRLAYTRSTKEKLIDLRRQAYRVILSELEKVETICGIMDDYIQHDDERYFEEEISSTHNRQISEHIKIAHDRFTDDYIIMSDKFIKLFEGFLLDLGNDDPNMIPPERHDHFANALRKGRPLLLAQARAEMPYSRSVWSRLRGKAR